MTKITDQQFEAILLRLESGEAIASVQADFPALEEDIAALQDLQDFFSAQRLSAKPDPAGLQSVLNQVQLLEASGDDEWGWGSWFTSLFRPVAYALPALAVLSVSGYVWQSQLPAVMVETPSESRLVADLPTAETPMDMAALAESLSEEFALDMAEFETVRDELEPLYTEQLFSAVTPAAL